MKLIKMLYLVITACLLISCQQGKSWEETLQSHTLADYEAFLQNNPETDKKDTIQMLIEALYFQTALETNSVASLTEFLTKYPESLRADTTQRVITALKWKKTQALNTIEAYESFLELEHISSYRASARTKIEALTWEKVKSGEDRKALIDFLCKYRFEDYKNDLPYSLVLKDVQGYRVTFHYQSAPYKDELPADESERVVTEDLSFSFYPDGTLIGMLDGVLEETYGWGGEFKGAYDLDTGFVGLEYRDTDFSDTEEEELGEWEPCDLDFETDELFIRGGTRRFDGKEFYITEISMITQED